MTIYNSDGQINLTVVPGSSYTGLYAADGSYNIVINDGSAIKGYYHPCGAINAVINETTRQAYAPNGSMNIKTQSDGVGYTFSSASVGPSTIPSFPTGAAGIWDVTNFSSSPRKTISNTAGGTAGTLDKNLWSHPRKFFSNTGSNPANSIWSQSACTVVDNNQAAPDGSTEASTLTSPDAVSQWFFYRTNTALPAGTYTMCLSVKSLSGGNQDFRIDANGVFTVKTATTSWTRMTHTFVAPGGVISLYMRALAAPTLAANFAVCDYELFSGSSDLNPNPLSAKPLAIQNSDCIVGINEYDAGTALVSGFVPHTTFGYSQFTSLNMSAWTVVAVVNPTAAYGALQAVMSKSGGGANGWPNFVSGTDMAGQPSGTLGPYISSSTYGVQDNITSTNIPIAGNSYSLNNQGLTYFVQRWSGTRTSTFINGVKLADGTAAPSVPTVLNLTLGGVTNNVVGNDISSGLSWKFMAIFPRSLSDLEVQNAVQNLQAKFGAPTNKKIIALTGDSLTQILPTWQGIIGPNLNPPRFLTSFALASADTDIATTGQLVKMNSMLSGALPQSEWVTVVWLGSNNVWAGEAAATTVTKLAAYIDALKAAGWQKVVCATLLPRNTAGMTITEAQFDTARATIRTAILSWVGNRINAVADVGDPANGTIGANLGSNNATYFLADKTHLTLAGQNIAEPIFRAAINSI